MVLPTSGALSLGQIATEYSDSQPNSMSEFYRGGSLVPTTVSGSATQAAPSSDGTYADFGGVTGLTLVRALTSTTTWVPSNGDNGGKNTVFRSAGGSITLGSSNSNRLLYGARGRDESGTISVSYSGGSTSKNFGTGGTIPINNTLNATGPYTISVNQDADIGYAYRSVTSSTVYTFTNNTGFDVTIEGTTVANGASSAISPSGDYNISFTINANPNVPTSGTIDFADFYGGRAS